MPAQNDHEGYMGLIQSSGPDWAYCSHNISGTPDITTVGATVTSGVSNADGSAATVLTALAHDVEFLRLGLSSAVSVSTNNNALLTILIDPAGGTSWSEFIRYLIVGGLHATSASSNVTCSGPSGFYDFPVWIPAGASIGAYARQVGSSNAQIFRVFAQAFGGNANPASWWCGQRVTSIGITAASSQGTSFEADDSGAFTSWTDFGSTLVADCGAVQWGVGGKLASSAWQNLLYQFEFGVAGRRIGPPLMRATATGENGWWTPTGPIFKRLPSGTQFQVRGTSSGTSEILSVAAYAVH